MLDNEFGLVMENARCAICAKDFKDWNIYRDHMNEDHKKEILTVKHSVNDKEGRLNEGTLRYGSKLKERANGIACPKGDGNQRCNMVESKTDDSGVLSKCRCGGVMFVPNNLTP